MVTFLDFYRLREQPFGVPPDPAYLYPSQTHREALASLSAGIKEDRGFMALIAEPGMGKTTLLYQLLEEWANSALTVAETDGYVQHRIPVAGYSGQPLFTPDALELIAQRSQGIPRNINNICYNSLSVAHLQGCARVTSEIVQRVVGQLLVESVAPQSSAMASRTVIPIA